MIEIYIVFENEFFQGDQINRVCNGVFSTEDKAQAHIMELEVDVDTVFDPMFRVSYDIIESYLDEPLTDV